jgi:energy-converting hydrogenase Eha subunit E
VVRVIVLLVVIGLLASAVVPAVDKPLWAWLNLLIIPVVLAIGGYWFTSSQN